MAQSALIPIVAVILGLGVLAQILSDRYEVPSIIFLLAAGVAIGPEGFGLLTQDSFGGGGLSAIVGLSVAIIVFEGAFHLKLQKLREAPAATIRLVTVGAAIALLGTAFAVRFAFGADWILAFLIGALLIATGPTVVTPILEVVPVRDRVAGALETEGIVNDVTAAILAVAVFDILLNEALAPTQILELFAERLGIGVVVGLLVAAVLWYVLWHVDLSRGDAPRNARLLVLAGAIVAFGVADTIATEAGVAAVATAGVVLGNLDIPYEEEISEFKGDITLIVLSFVFIALAALLRVEDLVALGLPGLAVVAAVALVIRPVLVLLSTIGGRFTTGERLFMGAVGPRGIIPASVATLFAVELQAAGQGEAARLLVGTVFLVIFATVVFQGGLARYIAEFLDVIPMRVLIIGGGRVGRVLADRLEDRGENVVIIENDDETVEKARNDGHAVHIGDGTDTDVLRAAGAENARIVAAATGDDDVNLLVAQLAKSKFDIETVIARANNPNNVEAFEDLGVRTISSTFATARALDDAIERPALADWLGSIGSVGDVQEVPVTGEAFIGKTIRELGPELPESCLVVLVSRDGETRVPDADFELREGDRVTLIGDHDDVRAAMAQCNPDN